MAKDSAQLEMFSLEEEEKKKRKKEPVRVEQNFVISRHILIYLILVILILFVMVYILGVETGRKWKVDKIYRDYIKGGG